MGIIGRKIAAAYLKDQAQDLGLFLWLAVQVKGIPQGKDAWLSLMKAAVGYVVQHGTPTEDEVRDALK